MNKIIKDIIQQITSQKPLRREGKVTNDGIDRKGIYEVAISQEDIDKLRGIKDGQ